MDQTLPPRLPAHLECAVQRVRMAARSAAEHTVESLGLAALACSSAVRRDALLGAQFELNRKLAVFALSFNEALDTDVARQAGTLVRTPGPAVTPDSLVASWESLTLVDDHEVEIHISADRFALEIAHACEWEIRELDAYMGTLMNLGAADHDRNPLRAEVVGQAMIRAVEAVADGPEARKILATEIGRSLAHAMRQTYSDIVADLRHAGVRPVGMAVRQTASRHHSGHGGLGQGADSRPSDLGDSQLGSAAASGAGRLSQRATISPGGGRSGFGASARGALAPTMGRVDGEMMALLRRLAQVGADADGWALQGGTPVRLSGHGQAAQADPGWHQADGSADGPALVAANLIHQHRDALRQVATGTLDHMLIDLVAGLFDQILSDAKVPPQMARQIARLQLPVLRAALGDTSFFSSRRHPVRRFINRIASLGTAVDDFSSAQGSALLEKVATLVQEVVDGEFDQIGVYEHKLALLERFIADEARAEVHALGAADALLARKEDQLRIHHRFAQGLDTALQGVPVPDYLRNFLADTWSQVIASVAADDGPDGERTQRARHVGRALVMSVQPKGAPAERQQFLRQLPQLMKDLNAGLDRIRCADATRQAFFAKLLPAHAESLKGQPLSTLQHNLLVHQVDAALALPVPTAADLPALGPASTSAVAALQAVAATARFTPAEAQAVGLVDEAAVDWSRAVDIDLGAEPEVSSADLQIDGLPDPEPVEPMRGHALADHVQIGFGYEMQLQGSWQRVRLAHVSAGRSFFVFTHGAKQRETVSMTYRMLCKLCAAGRLRALESAYLLERATARARRQLQELMPTRPAPALVATSRFTPPVTTPMPSPAGPGKPPDPPVRRGLGGFFSRRG